MLRNSYEAKTNKSPGLDNLLTKSINVSGIIYGILKEIMTNGEMTFSQRLAAISLIHKRGEKNVLQNYRTISVMNTD